MQHDLFPQPAFSITPEAGRSVPRLWVRRLVIWREPGKIVREITLKPGLNIIWSPDPGTSEAAPIGHGGGKTTFCRLLRYCLGEDSFAPEGQRRRVWEKFPNGHVGAEIMLNGRLWVIMRALGARRRDIAIENGALEEAIREGEPTTGIGPLREAITRAIISDAATLMPPTVGETGAWEAALAWATRDQECRFGHHLDWRDPNTDSRSPVRRASREDRLLIVRALLSALSMDEIATQSRENGEVSRLTSLRAELDRLDWQIGRVRADLAKVLGWGVGPGAGSDLDGAGYRAATAERLAKALELSIEATTTDLERARRARDAARDELLGLDRQLNEISVRIEEKKQTLTYMRSELPEAQARLIKETNPICPICKVPIDRALAEGCGISTATCDLESLQAGIAKRREEVQRMGHEIAALKAKEPQLNSEIARAEQKLKTHEQAVARLERALLGRSASIRAGERLVEDAEKYQALLAERSVIATSVEDISTRLDGIREELAKYRASAAEVVRRLSTRFDAVLRELVPGEIQGEAKLDGNGLTLRVELGGDRSTAAIDSLKVVAFDVAVLTLAVEGYTRLPGLLVHDSPREADLGNSIYSRLFYLVKRLEGFGPAPLFQYILTTTTEPPKEFRSDPWLRLTIRGAPAAERLLGVDL